MRTREFGDSGLKSSVIGFGGWPMGRGQYGDFNDEEAVKAVRTAYDNGITLFDTAAIYGWGYGEKLMGRALKGIREQIVLVTKGGRRWQQDNADRSTATVSDSSPEYLRETIDESLQRLGTDYIDLFLIHWPDKTRPMSVPMDVLEEAKRAGKIRHSGVSNFSVEMMADARATSPIVTNQIGYHIFDRRPEAEVMPWVQSHGMGIMAYGSLAHGLLTGTWSGSTSFTDDDWRRNRKNFGLETWSDENLRRNIIVAEKLKDIARQNHKTLPQLAISWVLANPTVTVALVGATTPEQVKENLAGDWDIPAELKKQIDDLVLTEGSGVGKPGDLIAT